MWGAGNESDKPFGPAIDMMGRLSIELDGTRTERGTTITLYIGEDGKEFLDSALMYSTLRKYCAFMPVKIFFEYEEIKPEKTEEEKAKEAEIKEKAAADSAEEKKDDKEETTEEKTEDDKVPVAINETEPLWVKNKGNKTYRVIKK